MAKAKVGKIEAEVQKAFKVKPKEGESYEDYSARIAAAVKADDKEVIWEKLSDEAQAFLNTMTVALKKEEDLPPFPADDEEEEDEAEAEEEDGEAEEDEKPKGKKAAPKKAEKKPAKTKGKKPAADEDEEEDEPVTKTKTKGKKEAAPKKKAKVVKEAAPKKKKGKAATLRILEVVYDHPGWSAQQVFDRLIKEGFKPTINTVTSYRADYLKYTRFLKEKGIKGLPSTD